MIWLILYLVIGFVFTLVQFLRLLDAEDAKTWKDIRSILFGFLIGTAFWPICVVIVFYDRDNL